MKQPSLTKGARSQGSARSRRDRIVLAALLLLGAVPGIGGIYRTLQVTLGGEVTSANQRFFDAPAPVVLHGAACALFALTGALQLSSGSAAGVRAHRVRGAIFIPSALIVATTGLWMEATYELPAHDGNLLSFFRGTFGTAMTVTTLLGVRSLLRKEYARHAAWMIRTYAIGMGAGTQVFVLGTWMLLAGAPDVWLRAWLMGASWILNVAVAEWVVRRRSSRSGARLLRPGAGRVSTGREVLES